MEPQVFMWPRLIGGPLHGQAIPDKIIGNPVMYVEEGQPNRTSLYIEQKFRFGNIAIRALVIEGREGYDTFAQDIAVHALETVGITVKES